MNLEWIGWRWQSKFSYLLKINDTEIDDYRTNLFLKVVGT